MKQTNYKTHMPPQIKMRASCKTNLEIIFADLSKVVLLLCFVDEFDIYAFFSLVIMSAH